jgi:hypothetical protein
MRQHVVIIVIAMILIINNHTIFFIFFTTSGCFCFFFLPYFFSGWMGRAGGLYDDAEDRRRCTGENFRFRPRDFTTSG